MTRILAADRAGIARAAEVLRAGGLVALPTETVYGLAADAGNAAAVARIFEAKGRPAFNPLICHVADRAGAARLAGISPLGDVLIDAFWPGPLTLVLPKRGDAPVANSVTAGLETVALRAPAHPAACALLAAFGGPLAAPSANPSGRISPTTAAHVAADLGDVVDLVLDGGPCPVGLESTIVGIAGARATLLRPGGIVAEAIEAAIGRPLERTGGAIVAPGMLSRHYAPHARLRLEATAPRADETMIGFGNVPGDLSLSPSGDLAEAAANLFTMLRAADAAGKPGIAVAPIPGHGLGRAINDRLRRAAASS